MKLTTIAFSINGKVRKNNEDGFIVYIDGSNSIFISSEIYNESTIYKSETISADTILAFVIDGMGGMGDGGPDRVGLGGHVLSALNDFSY